MKRFWTALVAASLVLALPEFAAAQRSSTAAREARSANAGAVGVISGGASGTYIRIAADLATVLDGDDLRILPVIGRGSLQNLKDIMFLRGIDIGIVQMDAREAMKDAGLENEAEKRLRYIARLYNEEFHLLAGPDIKDIRDLAGRKVNIDVPGSGTNLTARNVFAKLGVSPEFVTNDQATSYEKLRAGEIQAVAYVAGRPVRAMADFQEGGYHLLAIPFEGDIAESYLPAKFSASDYPRLVQPGETVDTVAVGSILAVFNWPRDTDRYRRIRRFVDAFFGRFDEFQQPARHPKWKDVSLAAEVPGWKRFKAAQDWLDRQGESAGKAHPAPAGRRAELGPSSLRHPSDLLTTSRLQP